MEIELVDPKPQLPEKDVLIRMSMADARLLVESDELADKVVGGMRSLHRRSAYPEFGPANRVLDRMFSALRDTLQK